MSIVAKLKSLVKDPPPEFVFELSEAGIAWVRTAEPAALQFQSLPVGVLKVSPLKDNVAQPEVLTRAVELLAPPVNGKGKARRAALILPDYSARVGVLDFDTFPTDYDEQLALIRFRVKRALAFDVESAMLSWHVQHKAQGAAKLDVVVSAIPDEVIARYEAPFRAAGYVPGFVTLSALASLPLGEEQDTGASTTLIVKLTGRVLALSVVQRQTVKVFRCVELHAVSDAEISDILVPTLAYMEDQLGARPESVRLCGFQNSPETAAHWSQELEAPVTLVTSRYGAPAPYNAGLLGYLETMES